jgi:hypothetical protein
VAHQTFSVSDRNIAFALFLTPYIVELIAITVFVLAVLS